MCREKCSKMGSEKQPSLDTLAQLETDSLNCIDNQEFTDLRKMDEDKNILRKRARRNFIKNALTFGLISVNELDRKARVKKASNVLEESIAYHCLLYTSPSPRDRG